MRSQRQEAAKCRGAANGAFNKADYEKATNQSSKAMEALMAADDFIKVVSAYQCFPKQYPENADSTDEKIPTLPDLRRLNMKSRYPAVRDAEPRCAEGSKKLESSNLFDKAAAHFALRIAIERFDQALKETRLDEDKRWVEKEQRETRKELDKIKDSVEVLVFNTDKRPLNGILLQDTKSWVFVTDPPEAHLWPMNFEVALAFSIVNKKDHKKIDNSRISKNLDVRVVAKGNDRHDDIVLDFEHKTEQVAGILTRDIWKLCGREIPRTVVEELQKPKAIEMRLQYRDGKIFIKLMGQGYDEDENGTVVHDQKTQTYLDLRKLNDQTLTKLGKFVVLDKNGNKLDLSSSEFQKKPPEEVLDYLSKNVKRYKWGPKYFDVFPKEERKFKDGYHQLAVFFRSPQGTDLRLVIVRAELTSAPTIKAGQINREK